MVRDTKPKMKKNGKKGAWPRSRNLLFKFREPLISLERVKVQASNFAHELKVRDRILTKKMQIWSKRGNGLDHVQHLGPVTF